MPEGQEDYSQGRKPLEIKNIKMQAPKGRKKRPGLIPMGHCSPKNKQCGRVRDVSVGNAHPTRLAPGISCALVTKIATEGFSTLRNLKLPM
jgi:hypothetical protein